MPHAGMPDRHRIALRVLLVVAYATTFAGGVALTIWTPPTNLGRPGDYLIRAAALLLIVGSLPCAWAAARARWRTERWATWLIIGGAGAYLIGIWSFVIVSTVERLGHACLATTFLALICYRAVEVDATARRHRDVIEEALS